MNCRTKYIVVASVILISIFKCYYLVAQEAKDIRIKEAPNYIFLNVIGDVSLVSLNYERSYFFSSKFRIAGKIGIGYNINFLLDKPSEHFFTLPNHLMAIYGNMYNFELGIGSTLIIGAESSSEYYLYPSAGYRLIFYTKDMGLTCIRLFGTILPNWDSYSYVAIPFGVSLGTSF